MNNEYLKEKLEQFNEKTTLVELQKYINDMIEIRGFDKQTPLEVMLLLTEEVGELAKEIRKSTHMKTDVQKSYKSTVDEEVADVFIYVLCMCRVMNINLLDAFKKKEEKNMKRKWE